MPRRIAILLLVVGVGAAVPPDAAAEIYRWTDADGVARFSDRPEDVPGEFRQDATEALRDEGPGDLAPAPGDAPAPPDALAVPDAPELAPPSLPTGDPGALVAKLLDFGALAVVGVALFGIAASLALMAFALRLACRLVGEEVPAFGRAVGVAALQMVAGVGLGILLAGIALAGVVDPAAPAFQGVQLLAGFFVNAFVVGRMLEQGFGRALVVTLIAVVLVTVVSVALALAIAFGVAGLVAGGAG